MPEATLESLLAYLREHGERYSSRYLRDELLEQGYDPALVAEAIAAYDAEPGKHSGMLWAGCSAFAIGIAVTLVNLGLLVYVFLSGFAVGGAYPSRADAKVGEGLKLWLALLVVELVVGLVLLLAGWLAREGAPGWSTLWRGLGGGLALGVILIVPVSLLLFGICVGMLKGPR